MSRAMPPLDSVRRCPKCNRDVAGGAAVYRGAGLDWSEYMKRTCHKCGYSWEEACAQGET